MSEISDLIKSKKKPPFEKQVEQRLVQKVKQMGGQCWKFSSPNNRGVSDRIVLLNGRVIFIEVKRDKGKMTVTQKRFEKKILENLGEFVCVTGYQGVDDFIKVLRNET